MKRFIRLLVGCSIMLTVAAWAQQPEASSTPGKNKNKQQRAEETTPAERQPGAKARGPQQNEGRRHEARKTEESATEAQPNATPAREQAGHEKREARREHHANTPASPAASAGAEASAAPAASPGQAHRGAREMKNRAKATTTTAPATPVASASAAAATTQQNTQVNASGKVKKIDQQQVQQIKTQHASFKAQAKPQQVPAVTFNQNYRIQEAQSWTGPQYEVFRSYRPERHDQGWYHSHYGRVELIGGGYYYFNNGYWYPAWGYNPSAEYYAYNGPIYVGHEAKPWDQVIADVQAELQQMGYYRGEVDGLLGPLTREALTAYQQDQGLIVTAAIDEPTLDSLGLS